MTTTRIEIDGHTYEAQVEGERVTVSMDGHVAGTGRWHGGRLEDCPALLGPARGQNESDAIYEAIEAAIRRNPLASRTLDDLLATIELLGGEIPDSIAADLPTFGGTEPERRGLADGIYSWDEGHVLLSGPWRIVARKEA